MHVYSQWGRHACNTTATEVVGSTTTPPPRRSNSDCLGAGSSLWPVYQMVETGLLGVFSHLYLIKKVRECTLDPSGKKSILLRGQVECQCIIYIF